VEGLHVNLRDSVANGGEQNAAAIGRPAETVLGSLPWLGEAMRFASGERDDPDVGALGVLCEGDIYGGEGDPMSVRRDGEVSDTLEFHHVFESERALLRKGRAGGEQKYGNEEATHECSPEGWDD
jgi:hypothetical protein